MEAVTEVTDAYDQHGIAWFRTTCTLKQNKKEFIPPRNWAALPPTAPTMRRAGNAVCIRTGPGATGPDAAGEGRHVVVVDADGADAIAVVERVIQRTCEAGAGFLARVPQVETQRGPSGRHFYFFAESGTIAATLKSTAGLTIDGAKTGVDIRAGYRGANGSASSEGVGFVFAPPTVVTGGGRYTLLPGPAIHEAPFMPDSLARALADGGATGASRVSAAPRASGRPAALTAPTTERTPPEEDVASVHASHRSDAALMSQALRAAQARAGATNTDRVGYPTRVVPIAGKPPIWGSPAVRIEFSHRRGETRVCPVTRMEHDSNHFFVALGVEEERTGLPAFFLYCHDTTECNPHRRHQMLAFVDPESYEALGIESGERHDIPTSLSIGQTIVLLGKLQEQVDRLIENPGGAWDTTVNLGDIACALCTAASKHAEMLPVAKAMLAQLVAASTMSAPEREHAARGFQHAKTAAQTLDPLTKVRGLAEGLSGKREQELMAVCEAITACTDAALEANVRKAAEHILKVLDDCERKQLSSNFTDLGMFFYYIWRRVARYACDSSQRTEEKQYTFFLFDGATYKHGKRRQFASKVKEHVRLVVTALEAIPLLKSRAESLEAKCTSSDIVTKAISETLIDSLTDNDKLAMCGLCTTEEFDRDLDAGNFIGFTNGVFDVKNLVFLPKGEVPFNVLVCKTTRYAYVGRDDPRCATKHAEIDDFLRTLHADVYTDPNDANLATMRMLSGSFLTRGNSYKKVIVFLGADGDNGKSTFTELIQLTLGDYAVTGNKLSLSGSHDQATLDPDLVANHKSLLCVFPEVQSNDGGVSCGFKFNGGKLKAITGDDEQPGRALYCDARCYKIGFVPLVHTNLMPQVDSNDPTATNRMWVARFDSKFPAGLKVPDPARRMYPRIKNLKECMREWAPYHFLMMVEGLREFRVRDEVLPPGAQTIVGTLAHQALVGQTPEGKMRAWVEGHLEHVPMGEKDNGMRLEELHGEYVRAGVHPKALGKTTFAAMLRGIFPGIGPHKNTSSSAFLYLLR